MLEVAGLRTRTSKTWQDEVNPRRFQREQFAGVVLHYPTAGPDSEVFDAEVDFTPQHVTAGGRNLYRVTQAGWHYGLGKDISGEFAGEDGVVGFGGRQGQDWLRFRLEKVGFLQWSTRTWEDLGGAPTYDRDNLIPETSTLTMGPEGSETELNISTRAIWSDIWSTPGGGFVDVVWRADGRQLKEEIFVSPAAREWATGQFPAGWTPNETWFGFVFRLDVSEIDRWVRAGVAEDIEGDFADDGEGIRQEDAQGRLLSFMPVSHGWSEPYQVGVDDEGDPIYEQDTVGLRKRIWKQGGNYWLLVGARVDQLNALHAGGVTFDPTNNYQPLEVAAKDTYLDSSNTGTNYETAATLKTDRTEKHTLIEFDISDIDNSTCDSATLSLWTTGGQSAKTYDIFSLAVGVATWTEAGATWDNYKAATAWPGSGGASTAGTDYEAGAIGSITYILAANTEAQAALTAARVQGWFGAVNTNYGISIAQGNGSSTTERSWHSSNNGTAGYCPKLSVVYTSARTPRPPAAYNTLAVY